ncbi:DUF3093 domain-containing protein [Pengzhenrongella sp.]|jgi:hypothetical protein|uniref:DUF3093 domain-containing protein n=1 Tax=Pengzhenrongella sp. TaxID=2888820 RepID=UPI002F92B50C
MTATPAPPRTASYSERLRPGPLGWAAVVILGVFMGISLFPVSPTIAIAIGVAILLGGTAVAVLAAPRVAVLGGELHAGHAHIPLGLLGKVTELTAVETRVELGTGLDARAFVCLRAGARTAIRVDVIDPADPTPYWLVSTRHPRELASALVQARKTAVGQGE